MALVSLFLGLPADQGLVGVAEMNKYHARRTQGVHGIWFHSMLEANYAQRLELLTHAEDPRERVDWWTYEVSFTLPVLKGRRAIRHIVDFLFSQGGCLKIVEVRGKRRRRGAPRGYG